MTGLTDMTDVLSGARRRDAEEFADLLESGRTCRDGDSARLVPLVGLARALSPAEHLPEPTFRSALQAQLVAAAAARVPTLPDQRTPERIRPSAPRWRSAVAAVAVATAVSGFGAAAASSLALPGDALYGLKLRVEAVQLSLAGSDLERGRELHEQAETRLGEAERLAAASSASTMSPSTREELAGSLTAMEAAATTGAAALVEAYEQTGDPEPMLLLSRFVERQQPRLQDLSVGFDPELRARVLSTVDTLAALGTRADALLSPIASGAKEAAGQPGRARVDSWAASRLAGRGALPPSAATGSGSVSSPDGLSAASSGSGATGTSSSIPSVTSLPAVTATAESLPDPTLPVPSVAVPPAPTETVVPALTTPALPSATVPAPAATCVAVPPLTTC